MNNEGQRVAVIGTPLAWLLLLPSVVLAWPGPGALLAYDPFPHLAGTGIVALFALPAALWIGCTKANRGAANAGRLLFTVWAFVLVAVLAGTPADGFESRRFAVLAGAWVVLFVGGSRLGAADRKRFAIGIVVLSTTWTLAACVGDGFTGEQQFAGVLGNSGPLSQAALAGAAIGAWFAATERGVVRVVGALAFASFVVHAGLAPVYAGALALIAALVSGICLSTRASSNGRVRAILALALVLVVGGVAALRQVSPPSAGDQPNIEASTDFGGFAVRKLIWARIPAAVGDHLALGLGPGQFQAGFPPYRDPLESELSRGGACRPESREVEHAHNDWLTGILELGLLAGVLWLVFLGLSARAALRALRRPDSTSNAIGIGALALLVNACVHSPLTYGPASAAIAFVLFGIVSANESASGGSRSRGLSGLAAAAIGLAGAFAAWPLITHGRALAEYVRAAKAIDELDPAHATPDDANRELLRAIAAIESALERAPDSAPARELAARFADDEDEAFEAWSDLLEVRPHSLAALTALGDLSAASGRLEAARACFQRALELEPTQPTVLRRLARIAFLEGEFETGKRHLDRVRACLGERELLELGSELVLLGRWAAGAEVLFARPFEDLVPETLFADSSDATVIDSQAAALRCLAHLAWARAHVQARDFPTAVRSYRQVLTPTKALDPLGAAAARAELAAALLLADREDEARRLASEIELDRRTREELPTWALEALAASGLLSGP